MSRAVTILTAFFLNITLGIQCLADDLDQLPPVEATATEATSAGERQESPAPLQGGARAQATGGKNKKVQLGFDDELVKGKVNNPEVDYLFARKQFNFKKMIKLREDFIPEVQKGKVEFGAGD